MAGFQIVATPVIALKLKQAAESGVKVFVLNAKGLESELPFPYQEITTKNDIGGLKELGKALIEAGKDAKDPGFKEFASSLKDVKVSKGITELATQYLSAKKAMIVYQQNILSIEAAKLIGEIALLSGHIGSPRDGILMVKAKNNSQGLIDLGIKAGVEALDDVKALIVFGEDSKLNRNNLEFLMVSDTHLTKTAAQADVVFPATSFASTDGTFTNTERRLLGVEAAVDEGVLSNWQLVQELALIFEEDFGFESTMDISKEMDDQLPKYKYAQIGEVLGGVLKPQDPNYWPVGEGKLIDPLPCSDSLMNTISERLPKPVKL